MADRTDWTERPRVLPSLTALRFFAAAGVVLYHLSVRLPPPGHVTLVRHALFGGASGVSFFFVLSGFVLCWGRTESRGAASFYRLRFARIYPNFVLAIVIASAVALWTAGKVDIKRQALAALLVQSWIPDFRTVFAGNGVSWSLTCEAFFYALFPIVAVAIRQVSVSGRRVLLMLLVLAPAAIAFLAPSLGRQPTTYWVVFFPLSRLPEFLIGVLIAMEVREGRWIRISPAVAVAITVAALAIAGYVYNGRYSVSIVVLAYVLLIGAVAMADIESRRSVLHHPVLIRLGQWSYAIYLLHATVILIVAKYVLPKRALTAGLGWIAVGAITAVLAGAMYHFWERPFSRLLRPGRTDRTEERLSRAPSSGTGTST